MCQLLLLPDKPGNTKYTPKHKLLPLRERPVERVSTRADACTIVELLAALLGGPQPTSLPMPCWRTSTAGYPICAALLRTRFWASAR